MPKFFIGFCKYPYIFSLNIVNDKIFLIEWFWFVALVTVAIFTFSSRYKNMFFKTSLAKSACQYIFNFNKSLFILFLHRLLPFLIFIFDIFRCDRISITDLFPHSLTLSYPLAYLGPITCHGESCSMAPNYHVPKTCCRLKFVTDRI